MKKTMAAQSLVIAAIALAVLNTTGSLLLSAALGVTVAILVYAARIEHGTKGDRVRFCPGCMAKQKMINELTRGSRNGQAK